MAISKGTVDILNKVDMEDIPNKVATVAHMGEAILRSTMVVADDPVEVAWVWRVERRWGWAPVCSVER